MQRKETYATTGPRMVVRFFGRLGLRGQDAHNRMPAADRLRQGRAHGRRSRARRRPGKAPTFLVAALKDPIGANLDRYQIVKGWLDRRRQAAREGLRRRVVGRAQAGRGDGKLPSVGSTVDVANATWTNTIGAPELIAVWKDPEFDPAQPAFYYGRVIEIPTPRWTAYDAKRFGVKPLAGTAMTVTERAYTSPIWYTPDALLTCRSSSEAGIPDGAATGPARSGLSRRAFAFGPRPARSARFAAAQDQPVGEDRIRRRQARAAGAALRRPPREARSQSAEVANTRRAGAGAAPHLDRGRRPRPPERDDPESVCTRRARRWSSSWLTRRRPCAAIRPST